MLASPECCHWDFCSVHIFQRLVTLLLPKSYCKMILFFMIGFRTDYELPSLVKMLHVQC